MTAALSAARYLLTFNEPGQPEQANLPKMIQFGRDNQGAHSHALNGPCFEAVWGRPGMIVSTIKHMGPVYALLETRKKTPPLTPEAIKALDSEPTRQLGEIIKAIFIGF